MPGQRFESRVRFACPDCKETVETSVAVPEPDWSGESAADMGSDDHVVVECPRCDAAFDGYAYNNAHDCQITLDDHPETRISAEPGHYSPDPDQDWDSYALPDDPYSIYQDSFSQMTELLGQIGSADGSNIVNRMIFAQHVSALEAYLADTLMKAVADGGAPLARLLANDRDLSKEKLTLAEIAAAPDAVGRRVGEVLRGVAYHNLSRVSALYTMALEIEILPPEAERDELFRAIHLRHDCVHRNGFDKDGARLSVFTPEFVNGAAARFRSIVDRIEFALSPF